MESNRDDITQDVATYRIKKGRPLVLGSRHFVTINALTQEFALDYTTIRSVIEKNGLRCVLGITKRGHVYYLYDPEELRPFLRPYFELPKESKRRTIMVDGKTYRTINSFVHLFRSEKISYDKIQAVIAENDISAVSGVDRGGHIMNFYSVRRVKKALSDFLSLPIEGGRLKTRRALAKTLGVSADTVESVVDEGLLEAARGRNPSDGTEEVFYNAALVKEHMDPYLALPQADKEGVLEVEGRTFVLLTALARTLETTRHKIRTAIERMNIKCEKGKDHLGRERDFYDAEEVRNAL